MSYGIRNINAIRLRQLMDDSRPTRAPIVGIPVTLDSGERVCIRVRRDLLKSALVHAEQAYWNESESRLVLNGGKRSCWKLISMDRNATLSWLIDWSTKQTKRAALPRENRKIAKLEHEIGVLERRKKKIYAHRPVNPICRPPREHVCSDWERERELAWHHGKRTRKVLAAKFTASALYAISHIARPDWKTLYANAAEILGKESISDQDKHSRVTRLTHGPSLNGYLRHPERWLAHMEKPWTRGRIDKPKMPLNEEMNEARKQFLEDVSMIHVIDGQIANLRELQTAVRESKAVGA